ncbi:MAG: hypothetical protein ACYC35_03765 [Pirellulales bacterium]
MIENAFHSDYLSQRRSGRLALSLGVAALVGLLLPAAFYLALGRNATATRQDAADGLGNATGQETENGNGGPAHRGDALPAGAGAAKTDPAAASNAPTAESPPASPDQSATTDFVPKTSSPGAPPAAPDSAAKPEAKSPPKADPAKSAAVEKAIQTARAAMRDRDLAKAREQLAWAADNAASPGQAAEVERLQTLWDYLDGFWEAVRKAIRSLKGSEEIEVGQTTVIVVEVRGETLTIRTAGQNLSYTALKMPSGLAFALAEGWFSKAEPSSKVFLGAFLAADAKGDRQRARRLWEEAKRAGVAVDLLLPELAGATAEGDSATSAESVKQLETKVAALETAAKQARNASALRETAQNVLALVDEAILAERLDLADRLAKTALTAARKAGDVRLSKLAVQRGKEIQTLLKDRPQPKKPLR